LTRVITPFPQTPQTMSKTNLSLDKPMSTELTQEAKLVFKTMPSPLVCRLKLFSKALDVPISTVAQNLLIDQWARTAARAKASGGVAIRPLPEFATETLEDGTQRLITGQRLFRYLVGFYEQEIRQASPRVFKTVQTEYLVQISRTTHPSQYWRLCGVSRLK